MLTIDDSGFPAPPNVTFAELASHATYRVAGKYYIKNSNTTAYNLSENVAVNTVAPNMLVERVTATLVITAPTP